MATIAETSAAAEELSREEGERLLDRQARRYLDMSGEEFREAWNAGAFEGDFRMEVIRVAMLLPLGG